MDFPIRLLMAKIKHWFDCSPYS